jgi:hypothetical protein
MRTKLVNQKLLGWQCSDDVSHASNAMQYRAVRRTPVKLLYATQVLREMFLSTKKLCMESGTPVFVALCNIWMRKRTGVRGAKS